jgi:hypothetical protein
LGAPRRETGGGLGGDEFEGGEAGFDVSGAVRPDNVHGAEIPFVEPTVSLLGENAGEPFTIQIHPLVSVSVEAGREIFQAFGIDGSDGGVEGRFGVLKFEWREGFLEISVRSSWILLPDVP